MKSAARRRRSPLSRLRPYWIVGVFVALVAGWAVIFGVNEPAFRLKQLEIAGLSRVSRSDVVARAAIDPAANIWLLNKRAIEARIEAIPYVATASLHRRPPGFVEIDVSEREPVACVRDTQARRVTIDRENRVLEEGCSAEGLVDYVLRTPIGERPGAYLRERELAALESDDGVLAADATHFRAFSHDRFGELVAMMPGGIAIQFGDEDDLDRKERLIHPILAQLGTRAADVASVDLRAPATPVVSYRKPAIRRHPQAVDTQ